MLETLRALAAVPLADDPTPVEELSRLRDSLGGGPRLLIKRDDAIRFAFGGNKVRKMRLVAADALAHGADTLITSGGIQSNHARVTAATAAKLGLRCVLVVNGTPQERHTGNALLAHLLGAEVRYVADRTARAACVQTVAEELRAAGRRPYVIPIGASTPLGAAGFVHGVAELLSQVAAPDLIVHSTSSGGTQAGLVAGCALARVRTRVLGISADEPSGLLAGEIRHIIDGLPPLLGNGCDLLAGVAVDVDDGFVGGGYGVPTTESREAIELLARTEAIFLDPTYTSKAMAGLVAKWRRGDFKHMDTVLFWHTGGQVGLFA